MAKGWDQEKRQKLAIRGLGWCLCVILWTVGLLTIFAVQVGQAIVPAGFHFSAAKFLHISSYAFLTVYLKWLPLRRERWWLLAFLSLHAIATEYFQQFIPGRTSTFTDVFIDHVGIALGMALTWKRWLPRRSNDSVHCPVQGNIPERSR